MHPQKRERGFTLVEILVTVTILAIAATVAIPYISASYADLKLSAAARTVMADLLFAQSQAIATQRSVYLIFTKNTSPHKYELWSFAGTPSVFGVMKRPAGATGTVTLGNATALIPDARLGDPKTPSYLNIGFDYLGQPFTFTDVSNLTGTSPTTAIDITLNSTTGGYTTTLSIQPFTGEITVK